MWALRLSPSRSTFHYSLFTIHFPQGPFFTFHSSLLTYFTQCGASAIAACSVGHRSALHRALQRAAFSRASFCAKGSRELSAPSQKAGVRCAACFGMMANAEPRIVNFVDSTFSSPVGWHVGADFCKFASRENRWCHICGSA